MIFKQFRDGEGCLSYLIGCEKKKEVGVIDPSLHIQQYLEILQGKSFHLQYVIDTHTHADHLSGAGLLAQKAKAKVIMSKETPLQRSIGMGKAPENIKEILKKTGEISVDWFISEGDKIQIGEISLSSPSGSRTYCRLPITRTSRKTRNRCSTRSTPCAAASRCSPT